MLSVHFSFRGITVIKNLIQSGRNLRVVHFCLIGLLPFEDQFKSLIIAEILLLELLQRRNCWRLNENRKQETAVIYFFIFV